MNLKPRRIADLLKELEVASIITIICRAKEGLSNLYRLLKVVSPKGGSGSSSPKTADPMSKKDLPGKQRMTGEGMQDSADESHAVEIHALNTHTHIQPSPAKERSIHFGGAIEEPDQDVCGFRNSGEEASDKNVSLKGKEVSDPIHIPPQITVNEKVIAVLTEFGVSEVRAKQLATTVIEAKLDDEYVRSLAEWIGEQTASRTIYNPAGLLVQMVHQLAPVSLPKSVKVSTLNGLQFEVEQKRKFIDVQLPQIIAIEERNLLEAKCERDKQRIQARLEMLLAQQAKEGRSLAKGTAYLADRGIEFSPDHLTGHTRLQQNSDGNIKGGYLYAPTY